MTNDRRFLMAMGLVVGILALWSLLSPPPREMPRPAAITPKALEIKAPIPAEEKLQEFQIGSFILQAGLERGGLQSLKVDGAELLKPNGAGLLEIQGEEERTTPWHHQLESGVLFSESVIPTQNLRLLRKVGAAEGAHPFLLQGAFEARNESDQPEELKLRWVSYKPLYAAHPQDRQFLAGTALLPNKKKISLQVKPGARNRLPAVPTWVGSQEKSYAVIVEPSLSLGEFHVEQSPAGEVVGWISLPRISLAPGERKEWGFRVYAGPLDLDSLRQAGMENAISFGAFSSIAIFLIRFLSWSQGWLHNYGLAICFLSFAVWLPFAPLTWYGMQMNKRTMEKMAAVKPQEGRIRQEHRNNPQRMQQELMGLYRKHGVNPASGCIGCLPLLVTMPVYIALYQVLNRAPELRGASFLWIQDLSKPDAFLRFPQPLPLLGDSLNLLPILSTVAMFVQQQVMQRPRSEMTEEQKLQTQVFKFFPLMLLAFFYTLPSGFMLYWVTNSLFMAGQQLLLSRIGKKS